MPGSDQSPVRLAVRQWWSPAASDIAVLQLEPFYPSDVGRPLNQPRIDLLPPRDGARVSAFGYPKSSSQGIGGNGIEVHMNATTTSGTVLDVHHQKRDIVMTPLPCYRTNMRIDSGMSGGPVFNERGRLCGIMCVSTTLADPADPAISYVSTLWPMLAICIDAPRVGYAAGGHYPMYELAREGIIDCVGLEHISLEEPSGGGAIVTCPSVYST